MRNRLPYLDFIEQVLQIPQTESTAPLVIDLFAGCGGLALGFEAAGLTLHIMVFLSEESVFFVSPTEEGGLGPKSHT